MDFNYLTLSGLTEYSLSLSLDWGPSELLRPTPFNVLASKTGPTTYEGTKGGVELGVHVFIKARDDKVSCPLPPHSPTQ